MYNINSWTIKETESVSEKWIIKYLNTRYLNITQIWDWNNTTSRVYLQKTATLCNKNVDI